jgi:hypothetical protein
MEKIKQELIKYFRMNKKDLIIPRKNVKSEILSLSEREL